jgi:GDP-L-fucose synthase
MVGSAIYKKLVDKSYRNIITNNKKKLNLLDQKKTFNFLKKTKPDWS